MKITRILPVTIVEAAKPHPDIAAMSTDQLIQLLQRKIAHLESNNSHNYSVVRKMLGRKSYQAIEGVPNLPTPELQQDYLNTTPVKNLYAEFLKNPSDFWTHMTRRTKDFKGTAYKLMFIGNKKELATHNIDKDDFDEFVDLQVYKDVDFAKINSLKSQLKRLVKKDAESQLTQLQARQAANPSTQAAPPPPPNVPGPAGKPAPNPFYMGSTRYNGSILSCPWVASSMQNMMKIFILACDKMGDPIAYIQHSKQTSTGADVFYAPTKSGKVYFYVDGSNGKNMKMMIQNPVVSRGVYSLRMRSMYVANDPAKTIVNMETYLPKKTTP